MDLESPLTLRAGSGGHRANQLDAAHAGSIGGVLNKAGAALLDLESCVPALAFFL